MSETPKTAPAAKPLEVIDPGEIDVVFVDWVITGGLHGSVFNLALGTIDQSRLDSDGRPKVVTAARLRFSREFGAQLQAILGNAITTQVAARQAAATISKPPLN